MTGEIESPVALSAFPAILDDTYVLSRFAYLRVLDNTFVLASPLTNRQLPIPTAPVLALLFKLREPVYLPAFLAELDPEMQSHVVPILEQLCEHRFLARADRDEAVDTWVRSNEDQGALRTWEFHDLLFHAQSRKGRGHQPVGGTYRFGRSAPPLPPRKQYPGYPHLKLPVPELADLAATDASFVSVMENRRSTRTFGSTPLTVAQLGEFLFRTCRVKTKKTANNKALVRRVYPSGGAMYPLEVYALVHRCDGLAAGLYHYDGLDHALTPLEVDENLLQRLQQDACRSASLSETPPILFCISARFGRTAQKYESIAYSLILKEVGVLYQTMWLAASAMHLAACGLGSGNADVFAQAIGSDYYAETSVGDFFLGPMP